MIVGRLECFLSSRYTKRLTSHLHTSEKITVDATAWPDYTRAHTAPGKGIREQNAPMKGGR
jgi:hypothetical protein